MRMHTTARPHLQLWLPYPETPTLTSTAVADDY